MASFPITLPALPLVTPQLNVGAVAAAVQVTAISAQPDALPLPFSQAQPAPEAATAPNTAQDGAAMRPDQVFMARQMVFQAADTPGLARSWRSMVRAYGAELASREQQARAGQLSPALLMAAQDGRVWRQPDGTAHPDAWRFTVHAGSEQPQHLQVLMNEEEQQPGRRRRRAALRLELELADGTRVVVLAEALPGGVALELYAPDEHAYARLRDMQPALEAAVGRAGLRVIHWKFFDRLPAGPVHASLPSSDVASALSLPVFRAMAELALLLPAAPETQSG
jgi:hypothetical protein